MDADYEERKGRTRGRPRGRPRGRQRALTRGIRISRRNKIESDDEEEEEEEQPKPIEIKSTPIHFDKDCDISALEAPTFTTLDRGPPAPMVRLSWNHPVNLIGEKVLSPRIHTCDSCNKPILIYGRMIPCKHVFCLYCAKREERVCTRCGDRVARIEQTGLGTVFMCTFSINDAICKRTYLSQRDLQAHIDHRHMKISKPDSKEERGCHRDPRGENDPRPTSRSDSRPSSDPRSNDNRDPFLFPRSFNPNQPPPLTPHSSGGVSHHIPVMTSSRTNLITVPIQEPPEQNYMSHPPPTFASPPPITQYNSYPPSAPPPPPPFATSIPPVPVPPPPPTRPQYEKQYNQWSAPPPQAPIAHPPPRHHPPPNAQQGTYYR